LKEETPSDKISDLSLSGEITELSKACSPQYLHQNMK
jgi:hypothetical protein